MLSSIKDKLLNVAKTVPLFSGSHAEKEEVQCEVELSAGSDIFSHFQNDWQILHSNNEENAKKAEEAADIVTNITDKISRDKESLAVMTHILCNSNLQLNIRNCTKQITSLQQSFHEVEKGLLHLEDLIDNIQFEKMKKEHRYHLQQYRERKNESLKKYESVLQDKYEKTVADAESKKKNDLEERRKVFDEAFKTDLEIYKKYKTIPKLDLPKKQPSALLEEIQVDYDEKELDQFFEENPSN